MSDEHGGHDETVGSVGEEAAKLFGALSGSLGDWARETTDHIDTGAPECDWCPVCRTVHVIKQASPEVRDHLASAAASLMQAAAGVLAATAKGADSGRSGPVERIDLDADTDEWPEDDQ